MLRSLKIQALACVAKYTASICLAERKPEVGASDHQENSIEARKAPGALDPAVFFPSPHGAKYITVTQGTSPSGVIF